ncbi:Rho guanine nucleotide exchange factor [Homalodisca vitripennis]|nr:Rho guanine nucleotide exchange factor [Homalodisca vitripennis]
MPADTSDWQTGPQAQPLPGMLLHISGPGSVLTWLNHKGEDSLKRHAKLASTLPAIKQQEQDFEKFYFISMTSSRDMCLMSVDEGNGERHVWARKLRTVTSRVASCAACQFWPPYLDAAPSIAHRARRVCLLWINVPHSKNNDASGSRQFSDYSGVTLPSGSEGCTVTAATPDMRAQQPGVRIYREEYLAPDLTKRAASGSRALLMVITEPMSILVTSAYGPFVSNVSFLRGGTASLLGSRETNPSWDKLRVVEHCNVCLLT